MFSLLVWLLLCLSLLLTRWLNQCVPEILYLWVRICICFFCLRPDFFSTSITSPTVFCNFSHLFACIKISIDTLNFLNWLKNFNRRRNYFAKDSLFNFNWWQLEKIWRLWRNTNKISIPSCLLCTHGYHNLIKLAMLCIWWGFERSLMKTWSFIYVFSKFMYSRRTKWYLLEKNVCSPLHLPKKKFQQFSFKCCSHVIKTQYI